MADDDIGARLVDALEANSGGPHAGHRAAHAKGTLCSGTFTATSAAAGLTRAEHLQGDALPMHVRFSNGGGNPTAPDAARDGRGMGVKVRLPSGGTTDIVAISLPVFFVRTPEDLLAFNVARRPDPATGGPDIEKVGAFLAEHPEALPAVTAAMSAQAPASYAQVAYHGLHAYRFVNAAGEGRYGRCHLVPEAGEATVSDDDAAALEPDYLRAELVQRLAAGPARFRLEVELAIDGDPIDDPSLAWPDDRERVHVADLAITALAYDREHDGDVLVFDPTRVPDGIELTDDPILRARPAAYSASVARRTRQSSG